MLTDGTNVFPVAVHLPAPVRFHIAFPSAVGISAIKTRAAGACAGVDAGVGIVGGAVVKIAIVGDVEVATASGAGVVLLSDAPTFFCLSFSVIN